MNFRDYKRERLKKPEAEPAHVFKGRAFEQEVALWLKQSFGCSQTECNERVLITQNARPYECDIHATKGSVLAGNLRKVAGVVFLIALFALFLNYLGLPILFHAIILILLSIASFALSFFVKGQREQHVWVECKNLKGNVKRDQINKLVLTVDMARQSQSAPWKPDIVLFFSATDYDRDALYFAKRHHIICYRKSNRGFVRMS